MLSILDTYRSIAHFFFGFISFLLFFCCNISCYDFPRNFHCSAQFAIDECRRYSFLWETNEPPRAYIKCFMILLIFSMALVLLFSFFAFVTASSWGPNFSLNKKSVIGSAHAIIGGVKNFWIHLPEKHLRINHSNEDGDCESFDNIKIKISKCLIQVRLSFRSNFIVFHSIFGCSLVFHLAIVSAFSLDEWEKKRKRKMRCVYVWVSLLW